MQLQRIALTNFRQHEFTELLLGRELLAIVGPNGSGKSTLLEAIAWALYGAPAARGRKETLRRRRAEGRARMSVELDFSLGSHGYSITRTLTGAELRQDGVVIANSTVSVTDRVRALLGMTRDEFFATYFTGQKELAVMSAMQPVERGQFLLRVLGYERLREAQELLRASRSARRSELAGLEQGLPDQAEVDGEVTRAETVLADSLAASDTARATAAAARMSVDQLRPRWNDLRQRLALWQRLEGELRVGEERVISSQTALASLDRELAAAITAGTRLEGLRQELKDWDALVAERTELDQVATGAASRTRAIARRDEVRERLAALTAEIGTLPGREVLEERIAARRAALEARGDADRRVSERRTRWNQDEQEVRTRLDQFRSRYRELKEQVELAQSQGEAGICPTCGRPLGADVKSLIELLTRQIEEIEVDGKYLRQRADQLKAPPEDLTSLEEEHRRLDIALRRATELLAEAETRSRQREVLEAERQRLATELERLESELSGPEARYDRARHDHVRDMLTRLEPRRREHDQLTGQASRAEALAADAAVAEAAATAAEAEVTRIRAGMVATELDPAEAAKVEQDLADAERRGSEAAVAAAGAEAAAEGARQLLDRARERQGEREMRVAAIRAATDDVDRLSELDRAYGDLRTELNVRLRPELNERASGFLNIITGGRYSDLELSEDYTATIMEDGDPKSVISGGEEDLVALALRLAISEMIAERAGQPLSMLVLDEVFGSLDEERRQSVLELLRGLADRFPQVVVVSHIEGIRDAADRLVRVEYDAGRGVSVVTEDAAEVDHVAQ